jgi:hypothetical protein
MSELLNSKRSSGSFRRNLLTNVSMLALLGYLGASQGAALAADDDPPTLWIELGGQFERIDSAHEIFAPPFVGNSPAADRAPMIAAQAPSPFSIGGEGKITFEPGDTNWVLSVAILYGRSGNERHENRQTQVPYVKQYFGANVYPQPGNDIFGDGQTNFKESHAVLDFKAGKDVGLGLFGADGKSVFSAGVRFAQFTSSSNVTLNARPEYKFGAVHSGKTRFFTYGHYVTYGYRTVNHFRRTNGATLQTKRNTHAFGPSISWDASLPVAGNNQDMTFTVDWGVAGAVLFGRQRAQIHHQTTGHYYKSSGARFKYPPLHHVTSSYAHGPYDHVRSRTVTIPNVGGFVGGTLKFVNAKISLGYKADLFFGAVDGGIDTRKSENIGFYGPFTTISIGIGG